jgi:Protein of unknown function (DUF805)
MALLGALGNDSDFPTALILPLIAIYILMLVFSIAFGIRRLNDTNHSGWLILISLIPLANAILTLYLIFAPGTDGPNDYGLPPPRNTAGVVILSCFVPLIAVIGILAAIALPAYQDYAARTKAASVSQQP